MGSHQYHPLKRLLLILNLTLVSCGSIFSQTRGYTTLRIYSSPPIIDGLFDDSAWRNADWEGSFFQNSPNNGAEPTDATAFKILYDNDFIYVALKAFVSDPNSIEKRMTRRDGMSGDRLTIEFDSYFDKRTSYMFGVNAAGVKNDGIIVREDGYPDLTTDPIWYVKTAKVRDGWQAEMKIPISQLRFNDDNEKVWGLQVVKFTFWNQEYDTWQNVPDSLSGWVRNYGELHGIKDLKAKKTVELAPYVLGKVEDPINQSENLKQSNTPIGLDAGIDGKIGISNDFTLDFAINPDFGQVEADPSRLNLTAYETYYQEKRPFFMEGKNITDYKINTGSNNQDNLFYSRRIGRSPQGYPVISDGETLTMPERTRILGALKLTGKTRNGLSVGILESFTNNENADIAQNGTSRKESVEPFTNYFLTRVQKDINQGNTLIGGMITNVLRDNNSESVNFLTKTATTAGADFTQFFRNKKYFMQANIATSRITGSEEAILFQQLSSRRYFQRPDAEHLSLNPAQISLAGNSGSLKFAKQVNSGLTYGSSFSGKSPGFETNDIGYLNKTGYFFGESWLGYAITKPFSIFRRVSLDGTMGYEFDWSGRNSLLTFDSKTSLDFTNLWSLDVQFARSFNITDNSLLRGGPGIKMPGIWEYQFRLSSNRTKRIFASVGAWQAFHDENSARNHELTGSLSYRPFDMLSIALAAKYGNYYNDLQYVRSTTINNDPRYIFGTLDRETLYFTFRVDYNISPEFTIQFYGSPYLSGGLYSDYKKITNSKDETYTNRFRGFDTNEISYSSDLDQYQVNEAGLDFANYSFHDPNFNFREFRSNLVLRWEYRAGSTVYLVWSQSRTGMSYEGDFSLSDDFSNLFNIHPSDVVMLKFSYRFIN